MEDGHCIRTTHAEINAVAFAARHGIKLEGCDLWVYGWDKGICHRCEKAVKAAGIKNIRVVPVEQ
jgi:dCMP deaminase